MEILWDTVHIIESPQISTIKLNKQESMSVANLYLYEHFCNRAETGRHHVCLTISFAIFLM